MIEVDEVSSDDNGKSYEIYFVGEHERVLIAYFQEKIYEGSIEISTHVIDSNEEHKIVSYFAIYNGCSIGPSFNRHSILGEIESMKNRPRR